MADKYTFIDEAGCFTFNRKQNVSKYFIICAVTLSDLTIRSSLDALRIDLLERGLSVGDYFHATTDAQAVRDEVYKCIMQHDFRVHAQVCEKSKAQPVTRSSRGRFYKYPVFYLFKYGIAKCISKNERLVLTAASLGNKKERKSYNEALDDVMRQTLAGGHVVDFRPNQCDPCLQLADYCAWAIQRKWESGGKDTRSHQIISNRIDYERDMWAHGEKHYY